MIQCQVDLRHLNTLRLGCKAAHFTEVSHIDQLREAISFAKSKNLSIVFLGEGSNVVLPAYLDALVVRIAFRGLTITEMPNDRFEVIAEAGENWDGLVELCTSKDLWGLENLSLIPGQVGAAPIQNIGAYGAEFKDHLSSLEVLDLSSGIVEILSTNDCRFGYRDSIFKQDFRDKFVVLNATFTLSQTANPILGYGGLQQELTNTFGKAEFTPTQIRQAVCRIRQQKLPDPAKTPNAGSFFKNPIVSELCALDIEKKYPDLVSFKASTGRKLAAGWLIERAGFKGIKAGPVGVYANQALVLITDGTTDAPELISLALKIQQRVVDLFGVHLEIEPRYYDKHGAIINT